MPPSLTATIAEPAPTSPTKRTTTSILKSFVTPRRSRASTQQSALSKTAPALKQSPYLELRNDTFVPLEPLVPPHPPFLDSYSRGKPTEKSKTLLGGSGKGLHRKSASVASLCGTSPEPEFKKTSHRHSAIFSLPKGSDEDLEAKKPGKARSTIDFSILKGVVRDRSPSKDKEKAPENHNRPLSSGSNYGLRLFGGKSKVEINKENQAPSGRTAAPRAMGPPSASPSQARPSKPLPAVPSNGKGWQPSASTDNHSSVIPQSFFTPKDRPKSYLQQQRTSQYTTQEPRHPPLSRGSNSSAAEYVQPSPRQSLDQQRQPTTPKSNSETTSLYTPTAYTPSSQRNFRGQDYDAALKARPKSAYYVPAPGPGLAGDGVGIGVRGISDSRGSWDSSRMSNDGRQASGSSSGDSMKSERSKGSQGSKGSNEGNKIDIDQAFEVLMDNRGVAQNMRQKLRNLDPRVKQHFINNESELEKLGGAPTPAAKALEPTNHHTLGGVSGLFGRRPPTGHTTRKSTSGIAASVPRRLEEPFNPTQGIPDATAGKRARPRSRTFGLGKEKDRSRSPMKKQKPGDSPTQPPPSPEKKKTMRLKNTLLGQPASVVLTTDASLAKTLRGGTIPASEFVTHLTLATAPSRKKDAGMKDVAVPKLHKLRLYLRNETLRWVEEFVTLGGMNALIHVLYRCLDLEWREEHEDNVLHELLLCLKAISTCRKALEQLETVEEEFFTRLIDVIFDEERKGPSEFTTRGLVFSLIFTYMAAAPVSFTKVKKGQDTRTTRARRILGYLSDKVPEESKRPPEFIEKIHTKRPYRRWHKEVNNVTKEVFWIFCHHDNVITVEVAEPQQGQPYEARHFPHERPPVPAAPYVGGVEWEATTYLATHLDLLNGIIASIETQEERNALRTDFKNSGWEKVMGRTLRTCKERLHGCSAVHDGLKTWIKAAREDSWCTTDVETRSSPNAATRGGRVGLVPPEEGDQTNHMAMKDSPAKRKSVVMEAPQVALDLPTLNLGARVEADGWAF